MYPVRIYIPEMQPFLSPFKVVLDWSFNFDFVFCVTYIGCCHVCLLKLVFSNIQHTCTSLLLRNVACTYLCTLSNFWTWFYVPWQVNESKCKRFLWRMTNWYKIGCFYCPISDVTVSWFSLSYFVSTFSSCFKEHLEVIATPYHLDSDIEIE